MKISTIYIFKFGFSEWYILSLLPKRWLKSVSFDAIFRKDNFFNLNMYCMGNPDIDKYKSFGVKVFK